ncbi:purine-cytosine permease family protein [Crystallibacter crystallopoietes]|uniref:purine-cytosine permease family protein n=1 Tax=Crystallibacter crystallopoietes TaxID=37928 RepID=UPI0002E4283B|nr:hypothetical protein [Arthrobacter crystallopoietes]
MINIRSNPAGLRTSLEDDPRVVEEQITEEYTNHVVPKSARKSRSQVLGSWSGITSAMAFVYYGALAAVLAGVQQAIIGLVLVVICYSLLGSYSVRDAVRWGLNSTLLSRRLFGHKGAAIAPLLVGLSLVYYAVFEGTIVAVALQSYFNVWDIRVWYAIVVVGMLPLMLGGMQTWLSKLNWVSLPIYFFGVTAAVLFAGMQVGWVGDWSAFSAAASSTPAIPGWLTVFVLYMGIFVLFPETQDAARFAKERDLKFHQNVTFGWAFYGVAYLFNGLVGIAIVGFAGSSDEVSESGVVQGIIDTLGLVGLIVIVVSQIRINSANFYFASVNLERFVGHFTKRGISRKAWVVLISLVVFVLMLTNVFSYISVALAWQAVLIVTLVGIMATHSALNPRQAPEFRTHRLKAVGPGFMVWIVSSGVGIVLLQLPAQAPVLSALAPMISLGLAVLLYIAVHLAGGSAVKERRADPVRDSVEDLWNVRVECDSCERSYVAQEMDVPEQGQSVQCLACQESKRDLEDAALPR